MKKLLVLFGLIELIAFLLINAYIHPKNDNTLVIASISNLNNYSKKLDINFVKETESFIINNKEDIYNTFYTALNNGMNYYTFKCSNNYSNCTNDIINAFNDKNRLFAINNLVSSYNSYEDFNLTFINNEFKIIFKKRYSNIEIELLNRQIDLILNNIINDKMTNEQKLITIHNYLIDNIEYNTKYTKANNALIDGYANCIGYADILNLILDKLDIPNYKIISNNHVWNLVYINNKWLHIDLTYDDPIIKSEYISYNYFLIDSNTLLSYQDNDHNYNKHLYSV